MSDALRSDLKVIADLIPNQARVLDVGCGDGALLAWLQQYKQVDGRGIEIDAECVRKAMSHGVSVIQGDVNTDLADFPTEVFDYAILSKSLQMMKDPVHILDELLRIATCAVVSVPNFGHWRNRFYLGARGKMPVTRSLHYQWYDTPNIHFCTIADFVELCDTMRIRIEKRLMVSHHGLPSRFRGKGMLANLLGEQGIFLLTR